MKTILLLSILALASCASFTAPPDPATGIRQDAPDDWVDSDPLNFPGDEWGEAQDHPLLTWQGRNAFFFGHPGFF